MLEPRNHFRVDGRESVMYSVDLEVFIHRVDLKHRALVAAQLKEGYPTFRLSYEACSLNRT